jgi:hypothetical protein
MKNLNSLEEMVFASCYSNKYLNASVWCNNEAAANIAIDFAVNAVLAFRKLDLKTISEKLERHHVEG